MTQKQIRRSYSNEFKRNAVELSGQSGPQEGVMSLAIHIRTSSCNS